MDRNPIKTQGRKAARSERLGPSAACCWCGRGSLEALISVRDSELAEAIRAQVLECHHPLGRTHDPEFTIVLCRSCHAEATESQARNEVTLMPLENVLDRLVACLRAVAAFLEGVLTAVERWIEEIDSLIRTLDQRYPSWRKRWGTEG